jgi:photosystem II stability/assembly factor-like uncharacterized protein
MPCIFDNIEAHLLNLFDLRKVQRLRRIAGSLRSWADFSERPHSSERHLCNLCHPWPDHIRSRHRGLSTVFFRTIATLVLLLAVSLHAADRWNDISTPLIDKLVSQGTKQAWPGGCSGVVVNRLNGEIVIKVVGLGLYRSADQGASWQRVDNNTVSGRDETGWATSTDPNNPKRMASFSLDGLAGWTVDGAQWKSFANNGRNWDYGSVDWGSPAPRTILTAKHETSPPGEVDLSTDGGVSWKKLGIALAENRDKVSMVGVMDATTFVYGNGKGIFRSTDAGVTWTQVSPANPQTRTPVLFQGTHYLGLAAGLLVSRDKGATWQPQGAAVSIWLGPFFGSGETDMVVVGEGGVHETRDAGKSWSRLAGLKPNAAGFSFGPKWFGCYAWDPIHRVVYASAMGSPVYKFEAGEPASKN